MKEAAAGLLNKKAVPKEEDLVAIDMTKNIKSFKDEDRIESEVSPALCIKKYLSVSILLCEI